jgi:hypothetical protein
LWVNRFSIPLEEIGNQPAYEGSSLNKVREIIESYYRQDLTIWTVSLPVFCKQPSMVFMASIAALKELERAKVKYYLSCYAVAFIESLMLEVMPPYKIKPAG